MRIGIDIGGTKIIGGIVERKGKVEITHRLPTGGKEGYRRVRERAIELINTILRESGVSRNEIKRIGIAAAGQIDKNSGTIIFSPNLGWHNAPLKKDMEKIFDAEVVIENDVNAATFGEWKFGLKERSRNVIGVFVGTGIGGGIIIDGRIYRGFSNVGGEIGHMIVNPHGYRCNCGNSGCFEAYCGGSYIVDRVRKSIYEGYRGKIWDLVEGNVDKLHTGHIEEAYLLGDTLCKSIWGETIEYMGAGLASLVNLFNPEIIVMGGGVINGSKQLIEDACTVMKKRAMKASLKDVRVERARHGDNAAIMGVAFIDV